MKKLFLATLTLIMLMACNNTADKSFKIYGWYGWSQKVSTDSLAHLFAQWKQEGMDGICMQAGGFNLERIQTAARIAHEQGLEYHAWIPTILQQGKDSTWYTVNRLGQSAYVPEDRAYVTYYATLDPHNPDVVDWLTSQYAAVADIPEVDYIQLDYIRYADVILAEGLWQKYDSTIHHVWCDTINGERRIHEYPGADYCYCDSCLADFQQQSGIDLRQRMAAGDDPATISEWAQFRQDQVTNLVSSITKAVHEKGKKVSADVFPGPKSYAMKMVRQEWNTWDIDMFLPMNYNDFYLQPASWVGTVTEEEVKSTSKPVMSGLFICPDWQNKQQVKDPEGSGLLPSEIAEAVDGARRAGAAGICLFTPDRMAPEHWEALRQAMK